MIRVYSTFYVHILHTMVSTKGKTIEMSAEENPNDEKRNAQSERKQELNTIILNSMKRLARTFK